MPQPTYIRSTPTTLHVAPATHYAWMLGDIELDYVVLDNREPPIAVVANITEMFVRAALEAKGEQPDAECEHHRGARRHLLRPGWVADLPEEYRRLTTGLIKLKMEQARCTHNRYATALGSALRQWGLTPDEQAACDEHRAAYDAHLDNFHAWSSAPGGEDSAPAQDERDPRADDTNAQVEE